MHLLSVIERILASVDLISSQITNHTDHRSASVLDAVESNTRSNGYKNL